MPDDRLEGLDPPSHILERLEEEERFNRRIFLDLPDPAIIVNREGLIERVNDKAQIFFIRERDELVGKPLSILLPDRFHAAHDEHFKKYYMNPVKREMGSGLELWAVDSGGAEIPVTIHLSPVIHASKGVLTLAVLRRKNG
jgi:PAS domain S-box-containing protein